MAKIKDLVENINSEFTYYPTFVQFVRNSGYSNVYTCVKTRSFEIDVLGVKYFKTVPPKLISIEVKMNDVSQVFHQAMIRSGKVDYSYVGLVFLNKLNYMFYKIQELWGSFKEYGIGLLIYDVERAFMFEILTAKRQPVSIMRKKMIIEKALKSVSEPHPKEFLAFLNRSSS